MSTNTVRDGAFFAVPADLPRGRHSLGRDQILGAQRERLMIAATELLALEGYRGVGVRRIAARAKVSLAAFYESFADKDECIFAAYDRFIETLVDRMISALSVPTAWEDAVTAVVEDYLATLQSDPVVARAFQVEMDALGRPARDRRRSALNGLALVLKSRREEHFPHAWPLPLSDYLGVVYAVRQVASDHLDINSRATLAGLTDDLGAWAAAALSRTSPSGHTATRPVPRSPTRVEEMSSR